MRNLPTIRVSLWFIFIALACLPFADLEITTLSSSVEMGRMAEGFLNLQTSYLLGLGTALVNTLAFAFAGVALGSVVGFGLALLFRFRIIRWCSAATRAVHELFWALLFLQFLGLHPITGILALALPYGAIFAKVYAEIIDETDPSPLDSLPVGTSHVASFMFVRLPEAWTQIVQYTAYRLECGIRSSAVLGFVGLPTMGFHLESFFSQGLYAEAWTLLIAFFILIATLRYWVRPVLIPIYVVAAFWLLWPEVGISIENVLRFFQEDILPAPIRQGLPFGELSIWIRNLFLQEALPGAFATVVLTQIALVVAGVLTLAVFPLVTQRLVGWYGSKVGHLVLVVMRSTPEYVLAYIFLLWWGPSMLPAVVALAVHNSAIIGHLIGRQADQLPMRPDATTGLNLYGYELVPRLYGRFLALLFYRWESILRETAILGILGIQTLGFFVDSSMQDIRIDRALILIGFTALLNIAVDAFSRNLREGLRLSVHASEI